MKNWYKILSVILISYTLIFGLLNKVPRLDILNETIRNVFYHVPIWFAMLFMMTVSLVYSLIALQKNTLKNDSKAYNAALVGFFFAIIFLGLIIYYGMNIKKIIAKLVLIKISR